MTNRSISQEERMKLEFENLNNNREDATTGIEEESMESSKKYIKNKTRR